MKKIILSLSASILLTFAAFAKIFPGSGPAFKQQQGPTISFTENKGQVHDQDYRPRPDVLYSVMAGNMAVHIKNNGVSYQLYKVDKSKETSKSPFSRGEIRGPACQQVGDETPEVTVYRVDLTWLNASTNFTQSEDEALPGYNNYYLENCPNGALEVKSYTGITLHNLYKGINLHYYEKNGELKHDYIVAPHTDYKQIQIQVDGAEINLKADGSMILTTPLGKVQEGAPLVYQNGKMLKAKWLIKNYSLSFEIENYNPDFELVIDPVTRLWGTYYGGAGKEYGLGCAADLSGNIYMTGATTSSLGTLMATTGSHQSAYGAGNGNFYGDAFLVKFNASGIRLWATYYGGTGDEFSGLAVTDAPGNIYMAGATTSTGNVIATIGSHQPVYGGGKDAFLVKFNSNGVRLWGTYYGGTGDEQGGAGAIDPFGNVYMYGSTDTPTGTAIATTGSHQSVKSTGSDAFLAKFDGNGNRLWGTYYGGIGSYDFGNSCATDGIGNVFMSGTTNSPSGTAIATPGSHQPTIGGNALDYDSFLVKFDANGNRLWATYYGGSELEPNGSCATDAAGNVYLSGSTISSSGTVIATPGSHQPVFGGGAAAMFIYDAYLVKFNSSGIRQWGTYYGGTGRDAGYGCVTDASGNIYFTGYAESNAGTVIATTGSHQPINGGGFDAFLVKFNTNGVRQSGTYYGGSGDDRGTSCCIDATDNVFMTGYTDSSATISIATVGSHQPTNGGGQDAFLVKFACSVPAQPSAISGNTIICSTSGGNVYSIITALDATSYTWSLPAGWSGSANTNTISASPGASGVFSVTANNACGVSQQQNLVVTVSACTGINKNDISDPPIKIYPNPAQGIINIELPSANELTIINTMGQIMYAAKLNQGSHQINVENLVKGIYVVRVMNMTDSWNIKMVKE